MCIKGVDFIQEKNKKNCNYNVIIARLDACHGIQLQGHIKIFIWYYYTYGFESLCPAIWQPIFDL